MQSQNPEHHPHPEPQIQSPQRRCRHIFAAGRQCGSPCLRTEQFCYFHHTTRRPVADPKSRAARNEVYDLPTPEDRDSIRAAIAQVMHAIAHNNIDPRRAGLILYSLQIALCALPKERYNEPSASRQSVAISAAAHPSTSRRSHRNSSPVSHIPAEPFIEETVLDEDYGLIAPASFLEPELTEEEDIGDQVQHDGRLLRNTLGYKLLKDVELYESRTQGWHRGQSDALAEAANTASISAAHGAAAVELAETLARAAANAVAEEAAFSAQVAAGMAKSRFYTGRDPDDEADAEATPTPELEPWQSPILPTLRAAAETSPCLPQPLPFVMPSSFCHSLLVCHSRRESASAFAAACPCRHSERSEESRRRSHRPNRSNLSASKAEPLSPLRSRLQPCHNRRLHSAAGAPPVAVSSRWVGSDAAQGG